MNHSSNHPDSDVTLHHSIVTVVGEPFHVFWTPEDAIVRAAGFFEADPLIDALPQHLKRRDIVDQSEGTVPDALRAYADGDLHALDALTVGQDGPEFRARVWDALRLVPAGSTVTYTELAHLAGRPKAVRAAASGCATNSIPVIVPCHRVTRTDGSIGDYAYGADIKTRLLRHEQAKL